MKIKQINKMKVSIFEEKELKEKFNLNDDKIKLILKYQIKFPELLQKKEGFCIDARNLHNKIVENVKENKTGDKFTQWIKRRIVKYNFQENEDYICLSQKSETQRKSGQKGIVIINNYFLTLEMAKMLAMIENNKVGHEIRKYFILMENTLRDNNEWNEIRGVEKDGYKKMNEYVKDWFTRQNYYCDEKGMYSREANLLNESLLGYKACEINYFLKNNDRMTRNHLSTNINLALKNLQELNESLLLADMNFAQRKDIIKNTCKNKYSHLKEEFLSIISR